VSLQRELVQVEIYCEKLRDLLSIDKASESLAIQNHPELGYHVAGAAVMGMKSADELLQTIDTGLTNRVRCTFDKTKLTSSTETPG
jgi:Kinesin motor domain